MHAEQSWQRSCPPSPGFSGFSHRVQVNGIADQLRAVLSHCGETSGNDLASRIRHSTLQFNNKTTFHRYRRQQGTSAECVVRWKNQEGATGSQRSLLTLYWNLGRNAEEAMTPEA